MYKILKNEKISPNSYLLEVMAPEVIERAMPGQFVIVMGKEDSERIPLTIYDYDKKTGVLSLIYQVIGASTEELSTLTDEIFAVTGPLGKPNEICANPEAFKGKRIVYVAGGVGIAPIYPQVKYLREKGFEIDIIYGAREESLLLIREKAEKVVRKVMYVTDDGSFGEKGFVTTVLEKEGKPKFACIDGPEFDGHKVNFDLAMKRMNIYKEEEKEKWDQMKKSLGKN